MLDKAKVVEILRTGNPVYKVNIIYMDHIDISLNFLGHKVGTMYVPSSKLGGYIKIWDCRELIQCLITKPDEDIYMWYGDSNKIEFMFVDSKYLDILTIEQLEMRIDTGNKEWVKEWNYFNEEGSIW